MAKRGKGLGGGITYRPGISSGLQMGSFLRCTDNSGAKVVMIVGVPKIKTRIRRLGEGLGGRQGHPQRYL
jgi:large subunit ribosomal protein L14